MATNNRMVTSLTIKKFLNMQQIQAESLKRRDKPENRKIYS
jgi:hypothetical protein